MVTTEDKKLALDQAAALEAARIASFVDPTTREAMAKLLLLSWYHRGALDALDQVKQNLGV